MPLGDIAGTVFTLVIGYPKIHWVFHYQANGTGFTFDDEPIKAELEAIPLTEPLVLSYIRHLLQDGVASVQRAIVERETALELSDCQQEVARWHQ